MRGHVPNARPARVASAYRTPEVAARCRSKSHGHATIPRRVPTPDAAAISRIPAGSEACLRPDGSSFRCRSSGAGVCSGGSIGTEHGLEDGKAWTTRLTGKGSGSRWSTPRYSTGGSASAIQDIDLGPHPPSMRAGRLRRGPPRPDRTTAPRQRHQVTLYLEARPVRRHQTTPGFEARSVRCHQMTQGFEAALIGVTR